MNLENIILCLVILTWSVALVAVGIFLLYNPPSPPELAAGLAIGFCAYLAHATDYFLVVYHKVKETCSRLRSLRGLVSTRYSSLFVILFYMARMIFLTWWVNLLQYLNNNVVREGKFYRISYSINGKLYSVYASPARGPDAVLAIIDEGDEDVTDDVAPFLRAQQSIARDLTPIMFKKRTLQILTAEGEYNFTGDEVIKLKHAEIPSRPETEGIEGIFGMLNALIKGVSARAGARPAPPAGSLLVPDPPD